MELCSAVVLLQLLKDFFLVVGLQSEPYWRSFLQGIQEHVQFLIVKVEMLERPGWHQVKVVELCVVKWLQIAFPEQSLCVILRNLISSRFPPASSNQRFAYWGSSFFPSRYQASEKIRKNCESGKSKPIRIVFPLPRQFFRREVFEPSPPS